MSGLLPICRPLEWAMLFSVAASLQTQNISLTFPYCHRMVWIQYVKYHTCEKVALIVGNCNYNNCLCRTSLGNVSFRIFENILHMSMKIIMFHV